MMRALAIVIRWIATLGVVISLNAYGQGWGTAEPIENDPANATGADIAVAANGNAVAVWVQADGPRTNIWARNYTTGSGLGTLQLIETITSGDAEYPRVAIAPNGIAHAIWLQHDGITPSLRASRFVPGSGWSAPKYLQFVLTDTGPPQIVVDPDGSAWAVWAELDHIGGTDVTNIYAAHSFNDLWSQPRLLENGPGNASLPKVVIDPFMNPFDTGYALVVWTQDDGAHSSVYSSHFQSLYGTWDPPVLVDQTDSDAFDVEMADGPSGFPVAVWRQRDAAGTMSVWAATANPWGTWSTPQQISDWLSFDISSAKVAGDPAGNATAVWADESMVLPPVGVTSNIWASRYTASSNSWGAAELLVSSIATAVAPAVTMDAGGNAILVWTQEAGLFPPFSIYAKRYAQGFGWGATELIESDDAGSAFNPLVAADSSGNAIAVWLQSDGVRFNVLQNRFSAVTSSTTSRTTTTTTSTTTTTIGAIDPEGGPAGRGIP